MRLLTSKESPLGWNVYHDKQLSNTMCCCILQIVKLLAAASIEIGRQLNHVKQIRGMKSCCDHE
jgi:hypothetical protein